MPNKKRRERMSKLYRVKLGRYRLTRRDILVLEKLIRIYADEYEKGKAKTFGQPTTPLGRRRHMPRKYADMHVIFDGERADSVKFLPKSIQNSRNFEIRCSTDLWIRFTPFSTIIGAQVLYATGAELNTMYEVVSKIKKYMEKCDKSFLNTVDLNN